MPTYDFKCQACGHKFTLMVAIKDKDQVRCPACEGDKIGQVYSSVGVVKKSDDNCAGCSSNKYGFG